MECLGLRGSDVDAAAEEAGSSASLGRAVAFGHLTQLLSHVLDQLTTADG